MKVVFVGPSLTDMPGELSRGIDIRPPAAKGDIIRAISDGARVIGLIDGYFEQTASVRHKEILYGLANGVVIAGAASMGALRAAECAAFGMLGVGKIFDRFASGQSVDDADVAQVHGPPETGYLSLSEPLVNVVFTIEALAAEELLSGSERQRMLACARNIFFKERNWRRIILGSGFADPRRDDVLALIAERKINQKKLDAMELMVLLQSDAFLPPPVAAWEFQVTSQWKKTAAPD